MSAKKKRRWWPWALGVVLVPLVLVVALLLGVLFSPGVDRALIVGGANWYSERIAGSVEIGVVEGSLGRGLSLSEIQALDRDGNTLVAVNELKLELRPGQLLRAAVSLPVLRVSGVEVHLRPDDEPGFADLAPDSAPKPESEEEPGGPFSLPVALRGSVDVRDASVIVHETSTSQDVLVAVRRVDVQVAGHQSVMAASVEVEDVRLGPADMRVAAITFDVGLEGGVGRIDELEVLADAGRLRIGEASGQFGLSGAFSGGAQIVEVSALAFESQANWVAAVTGLALPPVSVAAQGRVVRAGTTTASLALVADLPRIAAVSLEVDGDSQTREMRGAARAMVQPGAVAELLALPVSVSDTDESLSGPRVSGSRLGLLEFALRAEPDGGEVRGELVGTCRRCRLDRPGAAPPLRAEATWTPGAQAQSVRVAIETAPVSVSGSAARRGTDLQAGVGVTVRSIAQVQRSLLAWGAPASPRIDGTAWLGAGATRTGRTTLAALELGFDGPDGDSAHISLKGGQRDDLVWGQIGSLSGRHNSASVELEPDASATHNQGGGPLIMALVDEPAVSIEPIALVLRSGLSGPTAGPNETTPAKEANAGRITIAGDLHRDRRSNLELGVEGLRLKALGALIPRWTGRGTVDASVTASLDPQRGETWPVVTAWVRGRNLAYRGFGIGTLDLDARADQNAAGATINLSGPLVRSAFVRAGTRLDVDPESLAIAPGGGAYAFVDVDELRLRPVGKLLALPLGGTLGLDASVDLRGAKPRADVHVRGSQLRYSDPGLHGLAALKSLKLDVLYAGAARSMLEAELELEHADAAMIRLEASVPITVDHERAVPSISWRHADPRHRVALTVQALQLSALQPFIGQPVAGVADLALEVQGRADTPRATLEVHGRSLGYRGHALGRVDLESSYAEGRARVDLDARSPVVRTLQLRASVPVWAKLDPRRLEPRWGFDTSAPVSGEIAVAGASVARARRALPDLLPEQLADVEADVYLRSQLHGTLARPRADLDLALSRVAWKSERVGDVALHAEVDSRLLELSLLVRSGALRQVELEATAPLELSLLDGSAKWRSQDAHYLRVRGRGIDPEMLAAVAGNPGRDADDLDYTLNLAVDAYGTAEKFAAVANVDGLATADGQTLPVKVKLDADQDKQHLDIDVRLRATKGGDRALFRVTFDSQASVAKIVGKTQQVKDVPIELHAKADEVALALANPFLPNSVYDLVGQASGQLDAVGTVGTPELSGSLNLDDVGATVVPLRQRFDNGTVRFTFEGDRARLGQIHADAGPGTLDASGTLSMRDGALDGTVELVLDELPIVRPGLPRMALHTEIEAGLQRKPGKTARVDVGVRGTLVDVYGSNTDAPEPIPTLGSITFVSNEPDSTGDGDAEGGDSEDDEQPEGAKGGGLPAVVANVELEEPLRIVGPAVDMSWEGALGVDTRSGTVESSGQLTLREGRLDLLSAQFDVQQGTVTLPPGTDLTPYADVTATTNIDGVEIQAHVYGRTDRPELELTSTPPYDESTLFGMLVTGSADSGGGAAAAKQAAALLSVFSSPGLKRALTRRLGVDRIGLGFGETAAQPILSVGKNLTPKVYVETSYQFGADPSDPTRNKAEVELRYRFRPKWSLETYVGDAPAGGVGLYWTHTFDGPKVRAKVEAHRKAKEKRAAARAAAVKEKSSDPVQSDEPAEPSAPAASSAPRNHK